jgi:hypothetical protein
MTFLSLKCRQYIIAKEGFMKILLCSKKNKLVLKTCTFKNYKPNLPMKHLSALISAVIVILLIVFSFKSLMPDSGALLSAPTTEFSAERALVPLREIAKAPHYHGTEEHNSVREYLSTALKKIGLETQVQASFVLSNSTRGLIKPKNIVARLKGTGTGKSLVLLSHYDSALVPSPGASDAGSGIVTILESLRAYLASDKTPKNDIIVLFTDAEEIGLDGAALFVKEHPWATNVGLVLNFEARGSGGPSNMIVETNGGNTNLVKAFSNAEVPYPVASSLMYSVYKMLPNDTDSTIFREAGDIESIFFAFIDDHYDYHTANDTVENLDIESLQHQGSYLLPLLHYFADADLGSLKAMEDSVYVNIPVVTFIHYPFSWILPMLIIAFVLFFIVLFYGVSKHKIHIKAVLKGFIPFLVSLIICGILGFYGWKFIESIYPQYAEIQHGFKYNGHWYISFFVCLSLGILFKVYSIFLKNNTVQSSLAAPLFLWLLINTVVFVFLKGAAFFIIPVYFGIFSWFILLKFQSISYIGMALLAAPAIFIFAPLIQFFPVGLGSDHVVISSVFVVLLFGLLLTFFGFYKRKRFLSYLFFITALVFFIIAHTKSDFNETRNKPNSLVYYKKGDTNEAFWVSYDKILDPWTKQYLGENPEEASKYVQSSAGSKYNTGYRYAAKAPSIAIPEPIISLLTDSVNNENRVIQFSIKPQREVHQLMVYSDTLNVFKELKLNGVLASKNDSVGKKFYYRKNNHLLRYYRADNDSLTIEFSLDSNASMPAFTLLEYGFDLLENAELNVNPRDKTMMPKPFVNTDAIILEQTFSIEDLRIKKNNSIN